MRLGAGVFVILSLASPVAGAVTLPQIRGLDAAPLAAEVRQACREQGSDPERQRYHFVFAFSTSHFGSDAGHGEAMRQAAAQVARELLIPEDQFSVAAWEMGVWDWKGPFGVRSQQGDARAKEVARLFPRTHRAATTGGHDTEKAIVDLRARVQRAAPALAEKSLMLLFTSAEASMNAADRRPIGSNSRAYRAALAQWVRRPAKRIAFEAEKSGGRGDWVPRQMEVLVVLPKRLAGVTIAEGARSAIAAGRSAETRHAARSRGRSVAWVLAGFLGALAVAAVGWRYVPRGSAGSTTAPRVLQVGDRRFALDEVGEGQAWRLVGPRFAGPGAHDVCVGREMDGVPGVVLGRVVYRKGQLAVEVLGDQATLVRDGQTEGSRFLLSCGRHDFAIRGRHVADPAMPPVHFQVRFCIAAE